MEGRRGEARQRLQVGAERQFARLACVRGIGARGRAQYCEAAARLLLAAKGKIELGDEDAFELHAQRRTGLKERRKVLVHSLAILAIGLKVERTLVAEGSDGSNRSRR
jgi:hypothetical protein